MALWNMLDRVVSFRESVNLAAYYRMIGPKKWRRCLRCRRRLSKESIGIRCSTEFGGASLCKGCTKESKVKFGKSAIVGCLEGGVDKQFVFIPLSPSLRDLFCDWERRQFWRWMLGLE